MKKYPLKIERCMEFEGIGIINYYSKGHHDKEEFLKALAYAYDYQGDIEDVFYTDIKLSPSPTGYMVVNFIKEPCRGSFPVTVIEV